MIALQGKTGDLQVMADLDGDEEAESSHHNSQHDDCPEPIHTLTLRLGSLPAFQLSSGNGLVFFRHIYHFAAIAWWRCI